jgi:hypothetical protein
MRGALLLGLGALATGYSAAALSAQPEPLARLQGCWNVAGRVQDMPADSWLTVEPRLGGRFLLFKLSSVDRKEPYDAEVTVGATADGKLRAFWSDTFGAEGAIQGDGRIDGETLTIDYPYPDGTFRNRIEPTTAGWRWTIVSLDGDKEKPFATYSMVKAPCPAPATH